MAVVVSDTSPLRALGHLQLIPILGPMYGTVVVPNAVVAELSRTPRGLTPVDLSTYAFVQTRDAVDFARVESLLARLDRGEAEAIAIGVEIGANFILIDEALGRSIAKEHGLQPVGVVGILAQAKLAGLVAQVRPLLERLELELDFRLSDAVREAGLRLAGE